MKRGKPLARRKPLARGDGVLKRSKPLKAAKVLARNPRRRREDRALPGATGWTQRVFALYGRECLACPRKDAQPAVQAHHVVARQRIVNAPHLDEDERRALAYDARNGLPVCLRCHERHETATARIPRARLLRAHVEWAHEHGFGHVVDDVRLYPQRAGRQEARASAS